MNRFYAHTPPDGAPERWHLLSDHLNAVAEMAGGFGAAFGAEDVCRTLGIAHDAGKADPRFQAYLRACAEGRPARSTPHAAGGAAAAQAALDIFAAAALGHHAGLHDACSVGGELAVADPATVAAAAPWVADLRRPAVPAWVPADPEAAELFIRMCFSALTDADYLDTEAHMNSARAAERAPGRPITWYAEALDAHLERLQAGAADTVVNRVRADVLDACTRAADHAPGAFRLTVPTGGGKTLSGLAFALRHARRHGLRRVVVAIPYTSIIDQTAAVYASVFGADQVLEHHSGAEPGDDEEGQSAYEHRRRLAAENWDSPLVVTTTVQLFDSLFSNRSRACRKLHRLAGSVLLLDEAQTLPPDLLGPILDGLRELVAHYGCTVVFCTATQPDYSGIADSLLAQATEIVPAPTRHFEALRRVRYRDLPEPLAATEVAARVDAVPQALCVLNTRRHAVQVARACRPDESLFHLSTLLCPAHRRQVLEAVRQRLAAGLPARLVSTQVVDAGVDLDFPTVLRVMGPLDRIVQAAGRCNREGRLAEPGECLIFRLADAGAPRGWYATATGLAEAVVAAGVERLDHPEPMAETFRQLFTHTAIDAKGIRALRRSLSFEKVAHEFRMIDDTSVAMLVRDYDPDAADGLLATPEERRGRAWRRRYAEHAVSVPIYEMRRMESDGLVTTEPGGCKVYEGKYHTLVGIGSGEEPDPADLIV